MSDDRINASPMLDRDRVAGAIQRGVRLTVSPVYARAALHGQPVELTHDQALEVADVALEALAKTHPDGKTWLIKANENYRFRNDIDRLHARAELARERRTADSWRGQTLNAYVILLGVAAIWEWHWPRWTYPIIIGLGFGGGAALRQWLLRRAARKAAEQ